MPENIVMKLHKEGQTIIMALSDKGMIGSSYQEGGMNFKVTESFYAGDIVDRQIILRTIHTVNCINAVGQDSVDLLIENGYGSWDLVRRFDGIPHLQVYLF